MHYDIDIHDKRQSISVLIQLVIASYQRISIVLILFVFLLVNMCNFITCENDGQCVQDLTTIDCFKCQCKPGYTGKTCETTGGTLRMYLYFFVFLSILYFV